MTARLLKRLLDINNQLQRFFSLRVRLSYKQTAERERLQEEKDSKNQRLTICARSLKQAE